MKINFLNRKRYVSSDDETRPVKFVPLGNNVWQVVYADK